MAERDKEWIEDRARFANLVPKTYRTMRFATFTETEDNNAGWKASREFMDAFIKRYREGIEMDRYPFLLLFGPPGVGKTHIAHALAWSFLEGDINARYYQAEELFDDLRSSFDTHRYEERINFLKKVPVLILDDVGAHADTAWAMAKLDMIVDYRYRNESALVIITNDLNPIPPRIRDRLREGWGGLISGDSWRGGHGIHRPNRKAGK